MPPVNRVEKTESFLVLCFVNGIVITCYKVPVETCHVTNYEVKIPCHYYGEKFEVPLLILSYIHLTDSCLQYSFSVNPDIYSPILSRSLFTMQTTWLTSTNNTFIASKPNVALTLVPYSRDFCFYNITSAIRRTDSMMEFGWAYFSATDTIFVKRIFSSCFG